MNRMTTISRAALALCALAALAGCVRLAAPAPAPRPAVIEAKPAAQWRHGAMISAANPLAVEAGLEILRAGGSAVDAAIAVQAALGLVEPQSSGIGGGAFMIHYDAATGDVTAYDGREVAPMGARADMFLTPDGKPMSFPDAVRSGRSTGVPGAIAMLALAHREHGKLPWAAGFRPAARLARDGFAISPRLHESTRMVLGAGPIGPDLAAYLTRDGAPLPVGSILRNQAYAETLERIAARGPAGFYEGPVAAAIVAAATRAPTPGSLTPADLRAYRATRQEPICRAYRTVYLVCGMGPPSSGGIAVLSILGILENLDMSETGPTQTQGWHRFVEAQRLAYADRDMYVADDRFVQVPINGLLDKGYLASRAALIAPDQAMARVEAGAPPGAVRRGKDATGVENGTTHFVVVDDNGDVVSMTTTVEYIFGSQRMAAGFFLNNQLTDFSFRPTDDAGQPIANAVAPGKKPRSSMSPTIIFEDGAFRLAVGSPGGNAIIAYVSKAIIAMLDWGLTPQEAVDLPNVIARGPIVAETRRIDPALVDGLKAMGHQFREGRTGGEGSGLHAVMLSPDGALVGAADSRREGVARAP